MCVCVCVCGGGGGGGLGWDGTASNTCGRSGWICQTDFGDLYGVNITVKDICVLLR